MEKLLIMGVDTATPFIIEEAKRKGLWTIVTDYRTIEESPVKQQADEAWFLNVGDLDALEQRCRESMVTAVMGGNHEFCLDCTKELCGRLGLPFYANDTCWRIARDKAAFKKLCRELGLSVAKDYSVNDKIQYPVCVKPSDSNAQRGLSVVYDEKNFDAAYQKACDFSENKKIIIEQFLTGMELIIEGYADQGEIHFLFTGVMAKVDCSGKPCVSFPPHSPALAAYIQKQYYDKLKILLKKMDHQNGLFILQGFLEDDGEIYLIEPGIRFDGLLCSVLADQTYGTNSVSWMIDLARGIQPEIDWNSVTITSPGKYCAPYVVNCNPGKIVKIEGEEFIRKLPEVTVLLKRFAEGDTIYDVGNMTQAGYYLQIAADTPDEFVNILQLVNKTLYIYDQDGRNLIIPVTDYERIKDIVTVDSIYLLTK